MKTFKDRVLEGLNLDSRSGTGYEIIERASCLMAADGRREGARELHAQARALNYDFDSCLRIIATIEY